MAPPIPKPPPGAVVRALKIAIANAHCIPVLVRLGVFDRLDGRRSRVEEIAADTGTDAASLARVLAFCGCAGLVRADGDGSLELTEIGQMLVRDHAESFAGDAAVRGARRYVERWDGLEAILRGGTRSAAGVDLDVLDRAHVVAAHRVALADYAAAFSRSETYVDVESGDPALLAAVLQKSARSDGVLVGKAADLERAKSVLSAARVAQRCELVLSQDTLPPGDAYIVSHRLEALGDDEAVALLSRVRRAMKPTSRVLVIGPALRNPYDQIDIEGAASDLEMLLLTPGGKLRSQQELHALCARASLAAKPARFVGTTRTLAGEMHAGQIIEATAAPG